MKQSKPVWYLSKKNGYCPTCDDQASLLFIMCPSCSSLILECEGDHTFKAELPLNDGTVDLVCPACGGSTESAKTATSESIRKKGFTVDDYN